ncbi:MAG TPA: transglycosylase SLT domain-containing protein [Burkholderiaceae bacterium]|nr:transglycosylase SLT domain-containing protein [Burkholderiaceae bacterium]
MAFISVLQKSRSWLTGARALAVGVGLLALSQQALHADVWGYVDEEGITHFSPERVDERYALFYRAPVTGLPSGKSVKEMEVAPPVPEISVLSPKLAEFFESSPRYRLVQPLLKEAALAQRIDYELLQALIATESAFNASAVSPKGAVGLMQIMPDTGRRFGLGDDRWGPVEYKLTDPKTNIRIGARYLRFLMDMFPGKLELALASYNAGEGAVQKAGNKIPNFPETQAYVAMVTQIYTALKPPLPPPVVEIKSASRIRAELYGPGFVFSAPTEAYRLKMPNPVQAATPPGGAAGRGNMVQPIQASASPDPLIAAD